ncbi:hypothetical protein [Helicobacter apodemus]|uniref:hypothetical protein n=1 Tax=Helicobacter apodemus TaxID=135569 RepID=UPI0013A572DA|nr:hypothetical protein [Helicobacter apodemus]
MENNLDVPNTQTQDDTATFAAIAKLTKLDQQTLASNLLIMQTLKKILLLSCKK